MTPLFPLRDRIGAALTTACPRHSHCELMGPAVWEVVQAELEQRDAAAGELATELADARTEANNLDAEIARLEDLHARQLQDRDAEIAEAEKQIRDLNARLSTTGIESR